MMPIFITILVTGGETRDIASSKSGGLKFLGQFPILWLVGVFGVGIQLFRLWRRKGEL